MNGKRLNLSRGWCLTTGLCLTMVATQVGESWLVQGAEVGKAFDQAVVEAMLRIPEIDPAKYPHLRSAVDRYVAASKGTSHYLRVVEKLGLKDQLPEVANMLRVVPSTTQSAKAAEVLFKLGGAEQVAEGVNDPQDDKAVAAIAAIGYLNLEPATSLLSKVLDNTNRSRAVRTAAATALGRTPRGQKELLDFVRQGKVTEEIEFPIADALLGSNRPEIRDEAAKFLKPPVATAAAVLPPVRELEKMRGQIDHGKVVFSTTGTCSKCHKVRGEGKEVGPDLSEIGSKLSREELYVSILNPSAGVSHNYETYSLLTTDGVVVTGTLVSQTDQSTTIRTAEAVEQTFAKDDIESLKKQPISLMPADLQKNMTVQDLVSLVDYLTTLRKPAEQGASGVADNNRKTATGSGREASEALAGLRIADGLEVGLFSSEPMMLSPTNIDVDHLGRVWVCEAVNYRSFRNAQNEARQEGDRIVVLEDTDQDGKADKLTVFHQGTDIDSPHGVCVLGKDVIVSAGANVFVFTDDNGDLKADRKRVLFSGIQGVQHDHGIHSFTVGIDGKLYFNFGNEGKTIRTGDGKTIVDQAGNVVDDSRQPYQQGMVFRCNLDGSQFETLGWNFRNNWELCVDSFGSIWQSDNDDDGNRGTRINYVMEYGNYGYKDELTGASWQAERTGMESDIPHRHWHLHDPGVVPNLLQTGAGSPTGIMVYEGGLLPKVFHNQLIHCDPGPNVVRAYPVDRDKAGYRASIVNILEGVEDQWFRPVDVCAAPDGSLFIADWYDPGVGGHRMGDTARGRVFRVVPNGHRGYSLPRFDFESVEGATEALRSPNTAARYLAQQALARFGDKGEAALQGIATRDPSPRMRARAAWQWAQLPGRSQKVVDQLRRESDEDLRIVAVRLARQHGLDVIPLVRQMVADPSPAVRRELAIALRHHPSAEMPSLWTELAVQHDGTDRWYVEALGIGADRRWEECLDAWLKKVGEGWNSPAGRDILWRARAPQACEYLAKILAKVDDPAELDRYFRALDFHDEKVSTAALRTILSIK